MKARHFIALAISFLVLVSCESEKMVTLSNQETAIDKYVTGKLADCEIIHYPNSTRAIILPGAGEPLKAGDIIEMEYTGHIFNNGPGEQFCGGTVETPVGVGKLIPGLDEGLVGVREGEECYVIFTAKYGFDDEVVGTVPKMSPLIFSVKVIDIK